MGSSLSRKHKQLVVAAPHPPSPPPPPPPLIDPDHSDCKPRSDAEAALRSKFWTKELFLELHADTNCRLSMLPLDLLKMVASYCWLPWDACWWIAKDTCEERACDGRTWWTGVAKSRGGDWVSLAVSYAELPPFDELFSYIPGFMPLLGVIPLAGDSYNCLVFEDERRFQPVWKWLVENGGGDETTIKKIMTQLLEHIAAFAEAQQTPKTFKPTQITLEDVLYDGNSVVILNPWLRIIDERRNVMRASCGSPHFVAPEILCADGLFVEKSLIWSCGCIMYTLLCG